MPNANSSIVKKRKPSQSSRAKQPTLTSSDILEQLVKEHGGVSLYGIIMIMLGLIVLWSGTRLVTQIHTTREHYQELQQLKSEFRNLQIEHQRLLAEQQTFSTTPKTAYRAVVELNMYYPQLSERIILQPQSSNKETTSDNPQQATTNEAVQ